MQISECNSGMTNDIQVLFDHLKYIFLELKRLLHYAEGFFLVETSMITIFSVLASTSFLRNSTH